MNIKAVLFDLDGTLLPMDFDVFVKTYFGLLAKKLAPRGYKPKELIDAIWAGTAAMVRNNGEKLNGEVFWDDFAAHYGQQARGEEALLDEFYQTEFEQARAVCGFDPKAAETVRELKAMGYRVALATNPIFPGVGTRARIRWAGLKPEDFELYTTYENSRYSKPNLNYYREILQKLNLSAQDCLMVGNDVTEDMAAQELGMKVFLMTDCLINKKEKDISVYPRGGYAELMEYIGQMG